MLRHREAAACRRVGWTKTHDEFDGHLDPDNDESLSSARADRALGAAVTPRRGTFANDAYHWGMAGSRKMR